MQVITVKFKPFSPSHWGILNDTKHESKKINSRSDPQYTVHHIKYRDILQGLSVTRALVEEMKERGAQDGW